MKALPPPRLQHGLSLVEVLVALIIFAFGLLGAAGLQISTLRSNQYSSASAIATGLAKEYGEVMQSFPSAVLSTGSVTNTFFIDTSTFASTVDPSQCSAAAVTCTSTQLSQAMVKDWADRVRAALPGGRAEVCRDSTLRNAGGEFEWGGCDGSGDLVVIKMGWLARNDRGEQAVGDTRPLIVLTLLGNLRDFAAP